MKCQERKRNATSGSSGKIAPSRTGAHLSALGNESAASYWNYFIISRFVHTYLRDSVIFTFSISSVERFARQLVSVAGAVGDVIRSSVTLHHYRFFTNVNVLLASFHLTCAARSCCIEPLGSFGTKNETRTEPEFMIKRLNRPTDNI